MKDNKRQNDRMNGYFELSLDAPHEEVVSVLNKKWARVTTSVYMVTNFVPEGDPLRNHIRKTTLSILSFINTYGSSDRLASQYAVLNARQEAEHLVSLMKVGYGAGYVSEMNFDIVIQALEKIIEQFDMLAQVSRKTPVYEPILENPLEGFKEDEPALAKEPGQIKTTTKSKRQPNQNDNQIKTTKTSTASTNQKSYDRKETILNYFKTTKSEDVSINDIHAVLGDVSVKTVQREMNDLIESGAIEKHGAKRWARYSLRQ